MLRLIHTEREPSRVLDPAAVLAHAEQMYPALAAMSGRKAADQYLASVRDAAERIVRAEALNA